ncbi:uncharacterized protein LOC130648050 [Hydractinia symbiolongicarpus]|uniref:uncharacterized protein LOC130648050 n=1 Tax=Hydractinia symbiolongicarpus TaxID=13093 RepID=UPI002550D0A3|nr:uncharacterized protein LOC130648050 [Hydractinia symbiolongicarpus]
MKALSGSINLPLSRLRHNTNYKHSLVVVSSLFKPAGLIIKFKPFVSFLIVTAINIYRMTERNCIKNAELTQNTYLYICERERIYTHTPVQVLLIKKENTKFYCASILVELQYEKKRLSIKSTDALRVMSRNINLLSANMIAIFTLAILGVGLSGVYGDCHAELKKFNGRPPLGAFVPKCNTDGSYQQMQCHEGYCFCVFSQSGKEVLGTRVRFSQPKTCDMTRCFKARHQMLTLSQKLIGVRVASCDENGKFEKVQCHPSTGFCWCADPDTGKAIGEATRSAPKC